MSPTPTEKRIIRERKAAASGAVLVPLLERLLERECTPEDEADFAFLNMLMQVRAVPREKGVFSPSMLGSCVRQAYFSKRGEKKHLSHSPQTNGYFLHGNFVHFKWQFALWKAHRTGLLELLMVDDGLVSNGERPAVEVRVIDGDFGGTIDAIVALPTEYGLPNYAVDFKGINVIDFQKTVRKGAPIPYRRQLVGYAMLAAKKLGIEIEECLLISECKAGPISGGSPLGLHETRVPIEQYAGDVRKRLRTLRWFDAKDELPPIECVSTRHMGFQECPFNRYCLDEVKVAQREHERRARARSANLRVARSNGS